MPVPHPRCRHRDSGADPRGRRSDIERWRKPLVFFLDAPMSESEIVPGHRRGWPGATQGTAR